jgi:hypothetical protein
VEEVGVTATRGDVVVSQRVHRPDRFQKSTRSNKTSLNYNGEWKLRIDMTPTTTHTSVDNDDGMTPVTCELQHENNP